VSKTKFKHIAVREATHDRIAAAKKAYEAELGHKISMAEYMDIKSKPPK
jgi:hypothetical protein